MYDVIYVPLGEDEALKKRRQIVITELVNEGWAQHGIVELSDSLKNVCRVQVLMRAIFAGG